MNAQNLVDKMTPELNEIYAAWQKDGKIKNFENYEKQVVALCHKYGLGDHFESLHRRPFVLKILNGNEKICVKYSSKFPTIFYEDVSQSSPGMNI